MDLRAKSPIVFLIIVGAASMIANTGWRVVMNNFAVDTIGMTGVEIGLTHSFREISGLLAFTVLFLLMIFNEQKVAVLSLSTLGIGVAMTGYFPSVYGFYFTTLIMGIGFHYLEAVYQSLSTQIINKDDFSTSIGKIKSVASGAGFVTFSGIILAVNFFDASHLQIFLTCGILCFILAVYLVKFPQLMRGKPKQKNKIVIRREYRTYYALTFLSGARRQIFVVFSGLLMVQIFDYSISMVAALFMVSSLVTTAMLPIIGKLINKIGEKNGLLIEYFLLMVVFTLYALVDNHYLAGVLYVIDNVIFSFSIALATYFKKTIRHDEVLSTSSLSFTINHIGAVFLPFALGAVWMAGYKNVFLIGAAFAMTSFLVAVSINNNEEQAHNTI